MADKTLIAWCDHTFNAVWGCTKVSPGCKNCYADSLSSRYGHDVWGANKSRRTFGPKHWIEPYKWNRDAAEKGVQQRVFCGSMFDYAEDHDTTRQELEKLWPLIRNTKSLIWQLLTKRPENIANLLPPDLVGSPNIWLGTSIENNDYVWRRDELVKTEAVVHFVSYEPALGPLDKLNLDDIEWMIYGGESGGDFRKEDKQWARDMNARCQARGIAFFHKQSAAYRTEMGIELDGKIVREYPKLTVLNPA